MTIAPALVAFSTGRPVKTGYQIAQEALDQRLRNATLIPKEVPDLVKLSGGGRPITTNPAVPVLGNAPSVVAEGAAKPSFLSKFKPDSKWLKMPEFMKGNVGETAIYQKASGLAEKGIEKIAGGAAEGSARAGFASSATKFLGKMGAVSKSIPILGVALSTLFEIPAIIKGFKEGRGVAQIMKSGAVVTGTTVGAIALAALATNPFGWAAIALGTVGAIAGGWIGDKIGGGLWGSNKGTTQVAQAPVTQQAPAPFGTVAKPTNTEATTPFDINNVLADMPQLGAGI